MATGNYGTIRPANVTPDDVDILIYFKYIVIPIFVFY